MAILSGIRERLPGALKSREVLTLLLAAALATVSALFWPPERLGPMKAALAPALHVEYMGYDALFAMRGQALLDVDQRISVVTFDRNTEETLGVRWPIPRRYEAQVIRNLAQDGASVIACDFLFSDGTDHVNDLALDKALREAGNVVITNRLEHDSERKLIHMESPYYSDDLGIDFEAKAKTGFAEVPQDDDLVVRSWSPAQQFQGEWIPSFASSVYLRLVGRPEAKVTVTSKTVELAGLAVPRTGPSWYDEVTRAENPEVLLDFPGGITVFDHLFSFQQVYGSQFPKGYFKGKIVFIGLTGSDLIKEENEQFKTAYTSMNPEWSGWASWTEIPGVFVQAHAVNALLKGAFVYEIAPGWTWIYVFASSFFGLAAVRRYTNWRAWALFLGAMAGYQALVIYLFIAHRIHAPYVIPLSLMTLTTAIVAWFERGSIKKLWSSYVSPKVLDRILRAEGELGAHRTDASVLFTDIRGFTSFSEGQNPERIVAILNDHFESVTRFVDEEEGTLDKFMGDGLLAVFGAPINIANPEWHAVRAAWKMWEASKEPIEHSGEQFNFKMSVGIATGGIVAGHVGSKRRHDFTVIGDPVNFASRLQGLGREGGVQIDRATYDQVEAYVKVESLGFVEIRGKAVPMECFRVVEWSETVMARPEPEGSEPVTATNRA